MTKQKATPRSQSNEPDLKKINALMDEAEKLLKKSKRELKAARKLLEPYIPKDKQ